MHTEIRLPKQGEPYCPTIGCVRATGHTGSHMDGVTVENFTLRKALRDMLAHMFGPDDTGLSRSEIEAQARAALAQE